MITVHDLAQKIVSQSTDPVEEDEYISDEFFTEDGELTQEAKIEFNYVEIPRDLLELAEKILAEARQ